MERKRELYSSAIRSRHMIINALLELMSEKSFSDISISEIMKRADLVRRTFYAHYKTKEDVLVSHIDELISESIKDVVISVKSCNGTLALIYFRLWHNNKDLVLLLKNNNQLLQLKVFEKYIALLDENFDTFSNMGFSGKSEKYAPNFYAGAMWNLIDIWVDNGMNESAEELSDIFSELFFIGKNSDNACAFQNK